MDDETLVGDDDVFLEAVSLMRRFRWDQKAANHLERFRSHRNVVQRETSQQWAAAFDAYILGTHYAVQFGNDRTLTIRKHLESDSPHLVTVLARLHASACKVALEILTLLQARYSHAALARWRTLHEIAVTALFIQEHGEEAALRFWMHGAVERKRLASEHDLAGLNPLDPDKQAEIDADRQRVIERWGTEFDGAYGWAVPFTGKTRPSFRDIESSLDVLPRDGRWLYKWASVLVHPQIWGITLALSLTTDTVGSPEILTEGTDIDLPANAAMVSLLQCSVALYLVETDDDTEAAIQLKVLQQLIDEARKAISSISTIPPDSAP